MESRHSQLQAGLSMLAAPGEGDVETPEAAPRRSHELLDSEAERSARERLFDEVLSSVELVLVADGAAFWREEADHTLVLTASRSIPHDVLETFDRHATTPLQSIMQRWPESPLVAVPLNDPTNPIAEEIRQVTDHEGIVGLAGVPCRVPGEMMGMLLVVHRRPHPWTVRDLGLATGLAGQLATAMQNARLYGSVRSLANRLAAIHELSLRLNQLRDVTAIGEAIVAEVGRLVDCDTVRVYRLDHGGVFRPVAASGTFGGVESPPLETLSVGHGDTLPGWVARRNEPLIIPDASVERRSIFRSSFGPESLLLVPMSYGDAVKGVLVVSKDGVNKYGPDDEQALSIFGRYAAQAIVNADNIAELESQHALLEQQVAAQKRLLDVSEQLVSTLDPRHVLEQIAETIGTVVHYDWLTIYRYDAATDGIQSVLSRAGSEEGGAASPARQTLDEGLTSWVIGRGDAVCANDVGETVLAGGPDADGGLVGPSGSGTGPHLPRRRSGDGRLSENIIVVPLRVHGGVVGSLNLTRVGGVEAHFSENEFELSKLFAGQASIALQNAETHFTVSTRADLDALTGLRNHGTFQRDLAGMIEAAEPFSLLMMDLEFLQGLQRHLRTPGRGRPPADGRGGDRQRNAAERPGLPVRRGRVRAAPVRRVAEARRGRGGPGPARGRRKRPRLLRGRPRRSCERLRRRGALAGRRQVSGRTRRGGRRGAVSRQTAARGETGRRGRSRAAEAAGRGGSNDLAGGRSRSGGCRHRRRGRGRHGPPRRRTPGRARRVRGPGRRLPAARQADHDDCRGERGIPRNAAVLPSGIEPVGRRREGRPPRFPN